MCIETYHSHLVVKPCQLISTQNFQYQDETQQIYTLEVPVLRGQSTVMMDCLVFDSPSLPIRVGDCAKMATQSTSQFELLRGVPKGTLIKVKSWDLCVAVIDLAYPLHLKRCDLFDNSQIFSFGGSLSYAQNTNTNANANINTNLHQFGTGGYPTYVDHLLAKKKRPFLPRLFSSPT